MKRYYDVKQCSSIEDLEKMGMSRATVYRKAKQLGLKGKRKSKLDKYMNCTDHELKELVNEVVLNVLRDNSSTMIQVQADEPAKKQKSTAEKKPRKPRLKSIEEIACPKCGKGHIIKGRTAYGCNEFRNGCDMLLPFDSYPADLTPAKLNTMIKKAFKTK